jgi:hypothetical protein
LGWSLALVSQFLAKPKKFEAIESLKTAKTYYENTRDVLLVPPVLKKRLKQTEYLHMKPRYPRQSLCKEEIRNYLSYNGLNNSNSVLYVGVFFAA